jgi:periplasmic mercuric ion binding protein
MRLATFITAFLLAVPALAADTARIELSVPGMDCEACPITVRKALEKTPGVKTAKVDLPTKSAVVEYDPRVTTPERLMKSTANAGYPSTVKSGN